MTDITSPTFHQEFENAFPLLPLKYNVGWREITSLGAGGEVPVLAEPTDDISLAELLKFCHARDIKVYILGGGSDTVGADKPYTGIVVRLCQNDFIRVRPGRKHVTAGAGVRLSDLVSISARRGFGGIAPLAAIPGTVGGAVRMNAGAHGVSIGDYIAELCGYDMTGTPWSASGSELEWRYRQSSVPKDVIITAAILRLPECDTAEELRKISEELKHRRAKEPRGRSAGCAFKNVSADEPAGRLIDYCGLKSCISGEAYVSEKHANYIINSKHASEDDIINLMSQIRRCVAEETGLYLRPEVCFVDSEGRDRVCSATPAPRVAVLKGGSSSEKEVSLQSGAAVADALRDCGYDVDEVWVTDCEVTERIKKADVVFPALHGGWGENGELQQLLEDDKLCFVGCGSAASRKVFDKLLSKKIMDDTNIPTPRWCVVNRDRREISVELNFPVIVKPPREGSTVGIYKALDEKCLDACLDKAFKYDDELLIEEYIKGPEITVGIIDGRALPVIEIVTPNGFYDYDAKYLHNNGATNYLCPPEHVDEAIQKKASELALKFYEVTGSRDLLRVDFIIGSDGVPYMLEGNNIPGFTSDSLVPKACRKAGISFERLCAELVRAARQHG
ncbi:D-alanine--D-alanine ligase [Lentisphaerota bacterium ZTH]|nr:D-alanine--D-alanine ligase [Lentisphaerota bacterium]WET05720.1 D-alanine--D-alanine ligase [Lentisphaerota bacterium ZTH]